MQTKISAGYYQIPASVKFENDTWLINGSPAETQVCLAEYPCYSLKNSELGDSVLVIGDTELVHAKDLQAQKELEYSVAADYPALAKSLWLVGYAEGYYLGFSDKKNLFPLVINAPELEANLLELHIYLKSEHFNSENTSLDTIKLAVYDNSVAPEYIHFYQEAQSCSTVASVFASLVANNLVLVDIQPNLTNYDASSNLRYVEQLGSADLKFSSNEISGEDVISLCESAETGLLEQRSRFNIKSYIPEFNSTAVDLKVPCVSADENNLSLFISGTDDPSCSLSSYIFSLLEEDYAEDDDSLDIQTKVFSLIIASQCCANTALQPTLEYISSLLLSADDTEGLDKLFSKDFLFCDAFLYFRDRDLTLGADALKYIDNILSGDFRQSAYQIYAEEFGTPMQYNVARQYLDKSKMLQRRTKTGTMGTIKSVFPYATYPVANMAVLNSLAQGGYFGYTTIPIDYKYRLVEILLEGYSTFATLSSEKTSSYNRIPPIWYTYTSIASGAKSSEATDEEITKGIPKCFYIPLSSIQEFFKGKDTEAISARLLNALGVIYPEGKAKATLAKYKGSTSFTITPAYRQDRRGSQYIIVTSTNTAVNDANLAELRDCAPAFKFDFQQIASYDIANSSLPRWAIYRMFTLSGLPLIANSLKSEKTGYYCDKVGDNSAFADYAISHASHLAQLWIRCVITSAYMMNDNALLYKTSLADTDDLIDTEISKSYRATVRLFFADIDDKCPISTELDCPLLFKPEGDFSAYYNTPLGTAYKERTAIEYTLSTSDVNFLPPFLDIEYDTVEDGVLGAEEKDSASAFTAAYVGSYLQRELGAWLTLSDAQNPDSFRNKYFTAYKLLSNITNYYVSTGSCRAIEQNILGIVYYFSTHAEHYTLDDIINVFSVPDVFTEINTASSAICCLRKLNNYTSEKVEDVIQNTDDEPDNFDDDTPKAIVQPQNNSSELDSLFAELEKQLEDLDLPVQQEEEKRVFQGFTELMPRELGIAEASTPPEPEINLDNISDEPASEINTVSDTEPDNQEAGSATVSDLDAILAEEPDDLDDFFGTVEVTPLAETLITKSENENHKPIFNPENEQACLDMLQLLKSKHQVLAVNGMLVVAPDNTAEVVGKTPQDLYNFCKSHQAICFFNESNEFVLEMENKQFKGYCMTTRVRRIHSQIRDGSFRLDEYPSMPQLRYSNMLE